MLNSIKKKRAVISHGVVVLVVMLMGVTVSTSGFSQTYPSKPIRMLTSYPPGGSTDILARTVSQKMQESLGQNVMVEPRPGGATNIGAEAAAKAAADGYTLYLAIDATLVMNPWMPAKPAFDPIKDFAPISNLAVQCVIVVGSAKAPRKTLPELIAYGKANPGKLSYGASNVLTQMLAEQLKTFSGSDMTHIPFQGAPQQTQALISGDIQLAIVGVLPYANYVRDGQMVGLATTSPKREPRLPDMPTVREIGYPGLEGCNWLALFAPGGTPRPIIDRLNAEVGKALADATVRQRLQSSGMEPAYTTPDEMAALVRSDLAKWGPVIKAANLKRD